MQTRPAEPGAVHPRRSPPRSSGSALCVVYFVAHWADRRRSATATSSGCGPKSASPALAAVGPILFIFALAVLARRAQELRASARSMTQVAMRLAEPEALATDQVVTLSQAIRREVASMGDGIERALARASELETLVRAEVSDARALLFGERAAHPLADRRNGRSARSDRRQWRPRARRDRRRASGRRRRPRQHFRPSQRAPLQRGRRAVAALSTTRRRSPRRSTARAPRRSAASPSRARRCAGARSLGADVTARLSRSSDDSANALLSASPTSTSASG